MHGDVIITQCFTHSLKVSSKVCQEADFKEIETGHFPISSMPTFIGQYTNCLNSGVVPEGPYGVTTPGKCQGVVPPCMSSTVWSSTLSRQQVKDRESYFKSQ